MSMPGIVDFPHYQGDRLEIYFQVQEEVWDEGLQEWVAGAFENLTGKTVQGAIKLNKAAPDPPFLTFTCTISDQVADLGGATCVLTPVQAKTMVAATYVYDIQIKEDADHIDTIIAGTITMTGEVTTDA